MRSAGKIAKRLRLERLLSINSLATKSNVSNKTIKEFEAGKRKITPATKRKLFMDGLGLTIEQIHELGLA